MSIYSIPNAAKDQTSRQADHCQALKGHGFSRANRGAKSIRALAPAEALKADGFSRANHGAQSIRASAPAEVLKGHGFSRAIKCPEWARALAPEGWSLPRTRAVLATLLIASTLPALTGCASLFISKRKLLQPIPPTVVRSVSPNDLVAGLNAQWDKFQSLTVTVDIRASHLEKREGVATDYPTFRAYVLVKKPEMLRVQGKLPIVQTTMFDLGSDGKTFTLVVPPRSKAFNGENDNKGTSPNWYENLRPGPFYTAMVVRGLNQDELYSVTSDTSTEEDPATKRLRLHPEYVLNVQRRKPNSQQLYPVRVVTFRREDLEPYEQDLYDENGILQTQVIYSAYKDYGAGLMYPSKITMKRPQEEYQLSMTVERVNQNVQLTDEQFQIKVPEGTPVTHLQ